ncbi:MAG: tetratricopeptide repeat protein [Planctomycetaceae bacterium]|nr:tetratricopeptide repeat protein [Planctomycetaceae bacterium]
MMTGILALTAVSLSFLSGCGSKSDSAPPQASIPLSIRNTSRPDSDARNSTTNAPASETAASEEKVSLTPDSATKTGWSSEVVDQLVQKAAKAVVAGQRRTAIEALSQAIGATPKDARLFRIRADVYALMGENANARADFTTAIHMDPENADLRNYRGYFLMSSGLIADAMADFTEAIRLDPQHAAALNNRGLLLLGEQNYDEAITSFSKAIDSDRRYTDAWNNRGFARMKQGKLTEALADLQQALRLKEDYVTAWNNCGMVYMDQQNYAEAEKAFSRAVELNPMELRWLANRRAARIKLEMFAEAQQDSAKIEWLNDLNALTKQAARDSANPDSWIVRGRHLMNGAQYGAAVQDFTRALVVNPGNREALTSRAVAWLAMGDTEKAIMDCDESLVIEASTDAYSVRGDVWLQLNNLDQAIADYEAARRFDEQVASAYDLRAAKLQKEGREADAAEDRRKADGIRNALSGQVGSDATSKAPELPADIAAPE